MAIKITTCILFYISLKTRMRVAATSALRLLELRISVQVEWTECEGNPSKNLDHADKTHQYHLPCDCYQINN